MSEDGYPSRQLIVRIFTSDAHFFLLWTLSTMATAGILLLAATVTAETITILTIVYVSAVLCLAVSFGLGYVLLMLTGLYRRLSRIVAEEGSAVAALGRLGIGLATFVVSLAGVCLVLFGQSMLADAVAAGLFVGLLLASRQIVDSRMTTRAMTAPEREQCGTAVQEDVQYQTVIGAAGEMVNARSAGVFPSRGTVYLTEQAFDQLVTPQLEALAAHELGHVRGRHSGLVLSGNGLTAILALLALRGLLQNQWSLLVIAGVLAVCSAMAVAMVHRRLEVRADRFAAEHLGDVTQVIDMLEAVDACRGKTSQTSRSSIRAVVPGRVLAVGRGLFATHPSTDQRIERLRAQEHETVPRY
jgi:Zn-dependent protease with chaperone function